MKATTLLLLAVLLPGAARAQIEIESEIMYIENDVSVFEQDVVVSGDDISMSADQIRVAQPGGLITASGSPALLVMQRADAPVKIEAKQISYDPESGQALLPVGGRIVSADITVSAGWISADSKARSVQAHTEVQISSQQAVGSGDRLELRHGDALEMRGEPARLQIKSEDQEVQGQALLIRLVESSRRLYLEGSARTVSGGETINAEKISYNLDTGELATEAKPGERVRVIISEP